VGAASQQVSADANKAVLAALVSMQQHEQALQLVQQQPALLLPLAQLWQQQNQAGLPPVAVKLVAQAVGLCVAAGTPEASAAADALQSLVWVPGTSAAAAHEALQEGIGALQLTQLLCQHSRVDAVLRLLGVAVPVSANAWLSQQDAQAAVQAAAAAAASAGTEAQQEQLVLLLSSTDAAQQLVQAALRSMLATGSAQASAVACC
jgi:hypothetical protein